MGKNVNKPATLGSSQICQLKVTLKWSNPPIWRHLLVRGDTRLGKLHLILQVAMGWWDEHLHAFRIGNETYGIPDPEYPDGTLNESRVRLDKVADKGSKFLYEYDFGDSWTHEIKVEKILTPEPGVKYPRCIDGARACPPEDSGGVPGYERMLEIIANPKDEEYEEILEWLGDDFDPEAFDLKMVNRELAGCCG